MNQSVITDCLGNCLFNNVIVSGDVLKAELSKRDIFLMIIKATVTTFCMFYMRKVTNFVERKHCMNYTAQFKGQRFVNIFLKQLISSQIK